MLKPSYNRYNTRSQMAFDVPQQKTNTEQQALTFLWPKIWAKISHNTKNVKTVACFPNALERETSNKLCR